jgi:hypothetical protein
MSCLVLSTSPWVHLPRLLIYIPFLASSSISPSSSAHLYPLPRLPIYIPFLVSSSISRSQATVDVFPLSLSLSLPAHCRSCAQPLSIAATVDGVRSQSALSFSLTLSFSPSPSPSLFLSLSLPLPLPLQASTTSTARSFETWSFSITPPRRVPPTRPQCTGMHPPSSVVVYTQGRESGYGVRTRTRTLVHARDQIAQNPLPPRMGSSIRALDATKARPPYTPCSSHDVGTALIMACTSPIHGHVPQPSTPPRRVPHADAR